MARLERLSDVGIFCHDQARAKTFYTEKLGLKVRDEDPEFGYLALGATKGGADASLNLWQPPPEGSGPEHEQALAQIGTVTGLAFRTGDLTTTADRLKERGVEVEMEEEGFARVSDPDGNVAFLGEDPSAKGEAPGIRGLEFITVVTRDMEKADAFFTKVLGMAKEESRMEGAAFYRLQPGGTAVMPFTPAKEMYDNPEDYEADMEHIGEHTYIMFATPDVAATQAELLTQGVTFKTKAKEAAWGTYAEFQDPDGNVYMLYETK